MGIKLVTNRQDIKRDIKSFQEKVENDLITILQYVGEKFVKEARNMTWEQGGFEDDTGNLRSSIGYFILKDGIIINDNTEGTSQGISAAQHIFSQVEKNNGYQLIGVAGMKYASEVESRGYNVITVQADTALVNLDKLLKRYASKLSRMGVSFEDSGNSVTRKMI